MLYLLRAIGLGMVLIISSEGCFREEALRALAFIAIPVALTGAREDLTRGDDGRGAVVDARVAGIGLIRVEVRIEAFGADGGGAEAGAALSAVLAGAVIVLRAFSIIGMIVFREAGLRAPTLSDISAKPIRDTKKGNKAWAAFLTSALRSSTDDSVTETKGERSTICSVGSCWSWATTKPRTELRSKGLLFSRLVARPVIRLSSPSAASAMSPRVARAAFRVVTFWSAKTFATGVARTRACAWKAVPIALAILLTMFRHRILTLKLASLSLFLRTVPISPAWKSRRS